MSITPLEYRIKYIFYCLLYDIVYFLAIVIHADHLVTHMKVNVSIHLTLYYTACLLIIAFQCLISLEYRIKCVFYCLLCDIVHLSVIVFHADHLATTLR